MTGHGAHSRSAFLLALGAVAVLGGCGNAPPPKAAPPAPQVSVVTVHRVSVPVTIELPGRTSAYLVAQVRARVDGIVQKRDYREGTDVKAGQRLYQIDPAPYVATLDSAKAALRKARGERRRHAGAGRALRDPGRRQRRQQAGLRQRAFDARASGRGCCIGQARWSTAPRSTWGTPACCRRSPAARASRWSPRARTCRRARRRSMTTIQQLDPIYVDVTQSSVEGLRLRRDVASGRIRSTGPTRRR